MPDDAPAAGPSPAPGPDPEELPSDHRGLGSQATQEALPAREPFRTILRGVGLVEQTAGVVLLAIILVLVLIQVFQRWLPGNDWAWTGEIARYAMVWAAFFMAGYLLAHDQHIAIKVVDHILPARVLGGVMLLGHALIAVACAVAVYATYDFVSHDRGQVTAAAQIPLALIFAVVALGFASTAVRAVVVILTRDIHIVTGRDGAVA